MKTDQFIDLLAKDLGTSPVRVAPVLMRWLPLAVLAMAAAFLIILGIRQDLGIAAYPTAIKLAFGGLLAMTAGWGAMALSRPDAPAMRNLLPAFAGFAFVLLVLLADTSWLARPGFSVLAMQKCLVAIPMMALLPLAAFLLALRNGAVVRPAATGALAGLASAGLATLAYGLYCTEDSALFIATSYSMAAGLAAGIGALSARKVLAW